MKEIKCKYKIKDKVLCIKSFDNKFHKNECYFITNVHFNQHFNTTTILINDNYWFYHEITFELKRKYNMISVPIFSDYFKLQLPYPY